MKLVTDVKHYLFGVNFQLPLTTRLVLLFPALFCAWLIAVNLYYGFMPPLFAWYLFPVFVTLLNSGMSVCLDKDEVATFSVTLFGLPVVTKKDSNAKTMTLLLAEKDKVSLIPTPFHYTVRVPVASNKEALNLWQKALELRSKFKPN